MKKTILVLGSALFLTLITFSACQSRTTKENNAVDKVEEAKLNLAIAKTDLEVIRLDTISNFEQFKIEAEKIIITQEKNVTEFKNRLAIDKKEVNTDYDKKIVALENKHSELKRNLEDYKEDGKDKWISFRDEFNHDMNELGKAFKDLAVENIN